MKFDTLEKQNVSAIPEKIPVFKNLSTHNFPKYSEGSYIYGENDERI
jgi:hypothetical protein